MLITSTKLNVSFLNYYNIDIEPYWVEQEHIKTYIGIEIENIEALSTPYP